MDKLLNIPIVIWIAQIAYVIFALALLYFFVKALKLNNLPAFVAIYIICMLAVDIAWRLVVGRFIK